MTTNAAWTNPDMWRAAGALNALRHTIDESRSVVAASVLSRLQRDYDRLEQRHKRLTSEARRIVADGKPAEREALIHQILQFYRDAGELERVAAQKCIGL